MSMTQKVREVTLECQRHMDAILKLFVPGSKITLLVRQPGQPDGSQDFVMTNDFLEESIKALKIREQADLDAKNRRG